jgi:hypothetical protein
MSHTNRNFIIAYALLVGLPILGLVAVLRAGRNLAAPISVDGVWKFETDASRLAALPCVKSVSSLSGAAVTISQSGKNLLLNLNGSKAAASGTIEDNMLKASILPPAESSNESGCSSDQLLTLEARVDGNAESRSLVGTVSMSDCPTCKPVEFHAVRQARSTGKGAH